MNQGLSTKSSEVASGEVLPCEEYASWDQLVEASPHGTIFHFSWWLQASGYDFEILVCRDKEGKLIAGIPLPRVKRAGLTLFQSHILSPYLGPIFDLSNASKNFQKVTRMRRLGESLARAIRGYDLLHYEIAPRGPDLQGFLWAGFAVRVWYTFRFEAGCLLDRVFEQVAPEHRRKLARAQERQMTVEKGDNLDAFWTLNQKTFERQGLAMPWEESVVRRLWAAARARGLADLYLSRTVDGIYTAGVLVVHDHHTSYGLMAGSDPALRGFWGGNLALWQVIQDALRAGRAFDFWGSPERGIEHYFRGWGAEAKPVFALEKTGSFKGYIARAIRRLASTWRNT